MVGDWVIDEDWHVALHRSKTSTEPIGSHFRSLAERNDQVMQITAPAG
ncbi:MAG: hypothetical protein MZU91_06970 [Desulfosudis oleivorans]|nr:hypothetical protein [Desulfosudis oleivorans]